MSGNNRFAEFQKKLAKKQDLKGRKKGKEWGDFGESRYHLTTSSSDVVRAEEKEEKKPENRFAAFQEKLKHKIDLADRKNKKDWAGFNDSRYHLTQTLSDDEIDEDPKLDYVAGGKDVHTHESDNIPISEGTEDEIAYEWRKKLSTGQGLYKQKTSASGAQYGLKTGPADEPRKETKQGGKFGAFQAKLKKQNDLKVKKGGWEGFTEGRYDLSSTSSTFEQISSSSLPQAPPTPEVDVKKFRKLQTQLKEKLVLEDQERLPILTQRKDYINVVDPWGIKTFLYDDQTTVAHFKAHYFHRYSKAVDVLVAQGTAVPDYVRIKDIIFPDLKKLYVKKAKRADKYFRFR